MRDMQATIGTAVLALLAATLTACGPGQQDIDELKTQQRQILAKLADIEKKVGRGGRERPAPSRGRPGPDPNEVHDIPVGRSPVLGPEDAPVTIVEFSDFQCPFCAQTDPLIKKVVEKYPGEVRFVYKHLPLTSLHPAALPAAQAAVAAQQQGKFWQMHDALFAAKEGLGPESLKKYAENIGLDVPRFESDMAASDTKALIQEDVRLSRKIGVRGTPTIFINGKLLTQRSVEAMEAAINPILAEKTKG